MLPLDEDDTNTLIGLGLTFDQARIYLTLASLGKSTLKSLSNSARMDRSNVYRVLSKLQEMELIERKITSPSLYQAVPPKEAIPALLERKKLAFKVLEQKTTDLLHRSILPIIQDSADSEPFFLLVPAGSPTLRKVKELVARVNNEHKVLIYWRDIVRYFSIQEVVLLWNSLKNSGVTVKILIYYKQNETIPKSILNIQKKLDTRFIYSISPKCTLSIYDGQSALISISEDLSKKSQSLMVKNPNFVSIFEDYFEGLWSKAGNEIPICAET